MSVLLKLFYEEKTKTQLPSWIHPNDLKETQTIMAISCCYDKPASGRKPYSSDSSADSSSDSDTSSYSDDISSDGDEMDELRDCFNRAIVYLLEQDLSYASCLRLQLSGSYEGVFHRLFRGLKETVTRNLKDGFVNRYLTEE